MTEHIKIAWRNLWRNRKRSIITSASIFFAVLLSLLMRSLQLGSYDNMIKNAIEKYTGFIQIKSIDYIDNPSVNNSIKYDKSIIDKLTAINGIKTVSPRVESASLASYKSQTKGVVILGVDIEAEKNLSNPNNRLVKYRFTKQAVKQLESSPELSKEIIAKIKTCVNNSYVNTQSIELDLDLDEESTKIAMPIITKATKFTGNNLKANDIGVLISDKLSKFLKINVKDTLVLIGQGYHGVSAAGLFPVRGIVKMPTPDIDNKLIFMTLQQSQSFFDMPQMISYLAVNLNNNNTENIELKQKEITKTINNQHIIAQNWTQFNKVLYQQIESDSQSGILILGLLYFIVFFGIFGTVLMMIHERYREFGVLISIGMQRRALAFIVTIEMLFMGIIGIASGILMSLPVLYLGNKYPIQLTGNMAKSIEAMGMEAIMPLAWIDTYVWWQAVVVIVMVVLSSIYPLRSIYKLKEVEALRR